MTATSCGTTSPAVFCCVWGAPDNGCGEKPAAAAVPTTLQVAQKSYFRVLTRLVTRGTRIAFALPHGRRDRANHGAGGADRRGAESGARGAGGGAVGGARHATLPAPPA